MEISSIPRHQERSPSDPRPLLRLEVGRLRRAVSRQRFDTVVHVGLLDGVRRCCPVPAASLPVLDAGTRTEVVARLLDGYVGDTDQLAVADAWLTRAGEPLLQDEDLAWLSAATRAFAAIGADLEGFWTLTRTGWLDVRTGERRTWKRLRL